MNSKTIKVPTERQLASALGWFSIGLGLAQLLMPRRVGKIIGTRGSPILMRALGARELTSGLGILTQKKTTPWLWSRVAGDAVDLALLAGSRKAPGAHPGRITAAALAVAGVAAVDLITTYRSTPKSDLAPGVKKRKHGIEVKKSITVSRPQGDVFEYWRKFENLPTFMLHLQSVTVTGPKTSHWVAKAPLGKTIEWDAEIIDEKQNELIAWRSLPGSEVDNSGSVRFSKAPGGRGTIVQVEIHYTPPGGTLGAAFAKLFGENLEQQMRDDLRLFRQVMETGEIVTTVGQSAGRANSTSRKYDYVREDNTPSVSPAITP